MVAAVGRTKVVSFLLGHPVDAAYCYICCGMVCLSVCVSVFLSETLVSPVEMAESIVM